MTLATFQAQGKYVYIFLYLTYFFELFSANARWAEAEKEKKRAKLAVWRAEGPISAPQFSAAIQRTRGKKTLAQ